MNRILIAVKISAALVFSSAHLGQAQSIDCMTHDEFVAFVLNEPLSEDQRAYHSSQSLTESFPELSDQAFFAFMMNEPFDGPLEPIGPDTE